MNENVHMLPGVDRADLAAPAPVDVILDDASNSGLQDLVVIGRTIDGVLKVWSSSADGDAVVGLMTRGIHRILGDHDKAYLPDTVA